MTKRTREQREGENTSPSMTESRAMRSGHNRSHDMVRVPLLAEVLGAFHGQRDGMDRVAEIDFGRSDRKGFVGVIRVSD